MDCVLVFEGEPNYDDHRCIGQGCQICSKMRPRSRLISHPDSTGTPNHYCMGPGCPKCNTKRRVSTLQTRSTLHKCNSQRRALKCAARISSQFSNPDNMPSHSEQGEPFSRHYLKSRTKLLLHKWHCNFEMNSWALSWISCA